jgi:tetratricopeptide (TPR) repeat protein
MPAYHLKIWAAMALAFALTIPAPAVSADPLSEADGLLQSPTLDLPQARQALSLYEQTLSGSGALNAPLLTRLARACFILGDMSAKGQREGYYEKGRGYAERLLQQEPAGVVGHYWLAMNLAGLADVGGALRGRKLLPDILKELERAAAIDETYDQAGAHRVLGRIYYEAPRPPFSVGDLNKSLAHLSAAVRLAPETSTNHFYLAETLLRLGDKARARQELESTLKATRYAIQPANLREDHQEARRLLGELER